MIVLHWIGLCLTGRHSLVVQMSQSYPDWADQSSFVLKVWHAFEFFFAMFVRSRSSWEVR